MKVVTAEQMREIDRVTIEERKIPGLILMDRAGKAVAEDALERFRPDSVIVLAGRGNNGGDGFVAARYLHKFGIPCKVILFADPDTLRSDALAAWQALPEKLPREIRETAANLVSELEQYDLILDGLLGTGIHGPVTGLLGEVIEAMNAARIPTLAIDIPSGLPSDGGAPEGPCVRAAVSVTMALPKYGMVVQPGLQYTGIVAIADLSFPEDLLKNEALQLNVLDPGEIGRLLPRRPPDGNKGTFGKVLILAGSTGMAGAGVMACRSASRSGVGLVYCGMPQDLSLAFEMMLLETVKRPLPTAHPGHFDASSIDAALNAASDVNAVAIGPGLSTHDGVAEFVQAICENVSVPLIIDADGLNALGESPEILKKRKGPTILTPHPAEMGRLIGKSAAEVQADRLGVAQEFVKQYGVILVLKGAQTLIARPDGQVFINTSGNTGLAKGGSGDVLTGLIAGLAAQGMSPADAAVSGVFIHGMAGDLAARKTGVRATIPSDVIDNLGEAFLAVEKAGR